MPSTPTDLRNKQPASTWLRPGDEEEVDTLLVAVSGAPAPAQGLDLAVASVLWLVVVVMTAPAALRAMAPRDGTTPRTGSAPARQA